MTPLALKVLSAVETSQPVTLTRLTSELGLRMEQIAGSLSRLKRDGYVTQDSDLRWSRRATNGGGAAHNFSSVLPPGEKRACARCRVEKGAPGFYAGETVCRQCRNTEAVVDAAGKAEAPGRRVCTACEEEKSENEFYERQLRCKACCIAAVNARRDQPKPIAPPLSSAQVIPIDRTKQTPAARQVIDALVAQREQLTAAYTARCHSIDTTIEEIGRLYGMPEP